MKRSGPLKRRNRRRIDTGWEQARRFVVDNAIAQMRRGTP